MRPVIVKKIAVFFIIISISFSGCSWFTPDPQEAVNIGVAKLAEVEKMSTAFSLNGTVLMPQGEKPASIRISLNSEGVSDVSNEDSPLSEMNLTLSLKLDDEGGSGEAGLKFIGNDLFLKLNDLVLPGEDGQRLKQQLAAVFGTWWRIPIGEAGKLKSLTDEQKQLKERLKTSQFFANAKFDVEEELKGVETRRYRVELNKQAVKDLILEAARLAGNEVPPEEMAAIDSSLDEYEFSGAVWVGKDKIARRIQGTLTAQPIQGPSSTLDLDYEIWDIGKAVNVEIPEQAQQFNPLWMTPIYAALDALTQDKPEAGEQQEAPTPIDDAPLGAEQVKQ